jgi:endo-1,4-beta-xylanase
MTRILILLSAVLLWVSCGGGQKNENAQEEISLAKKYENNFKLGTILAYNQINGSDKLSIDIAKKHFNAVTAEDCMKGETMQPEEGKFDFTLGDKVVDFAQQNNMYMVGHVLVWHSQQPKWFFTDKEGKTVSRDTLIERIKRHIFAVAGHYKGKIDAWDVVNEAFEDDGTFRKSPYYEIIGEDFINLAFKFAHEADPEAKLTLNDYNVCKPEKCDAIINKINQMRSEGLQVDYAGMQMHCTMDFPTVEQLETSLKKFEDNKIAVHITEFDLTSIPFPMGNTAEISARAGYQEIYDPYRNGLPDSARNAINQRFKELFDTFVKHSSNIERVTVWGITDSGSWRLNWPIMGRTDFPTLFYKDGKMKEFLLK